MPRREGADLLTKTRQVLGLAGEDDSPRPVVTVEQGPDADGVSGGDEGISFPVVDNQSELRVQPGEHLQAVLPVERQQNLAVAAALEGVALLLELPLQGPEAVNLAVAHQAVRPQPEGLHALRRQAHDGQPVEAEPAGRGLHDTGHVGSPGNRAVEKGLELLPGNFLLFKSHDRAHKRTSE